MTLTWQSPEQMGELYAWLPEFYMPAAWWGDRAEGDEERVVGILV
jgi:hypothetical protein